MRLFTYTIFILLLLGSCENNSSIEGLWLVKAVTVGEEEMTPNARWMRFNRDNTQQSGNGWFQHSIGKWELTDHQLSITNTNGLIDPNGPFEVSLENSNSMVWKRTEEGAKVQVSLERIHELPTTFGDQLLGLWKLETMEGNGVYFSNEAASDDYLFFRWDKRFVIGTQGKRIHGVYQVHGHRPEVNLFPFSQELPRTSWKIQFEKEVIVLEELNADSTVSRTFQRIGEFPE